MDVADNGARIGLEHTDAMYEALVEQVPAVVYVGSDTEACSTLYVSPQVEQMLGYPVEEWLVDPGLWVKLLHPEDRQKALAEADRARATGEPFDAQYRLLARDGCDERVVWVHDKAVQVEAGGSVVWQGVMLDITERQRATEELRRSEHLFRKTFESAGVGIAHLTPEGRWLRVNDRLCEISGYSREELLEKTFLELTPPEDRKGSIERVQRMLEGKLGPYSLERRYIRKDGLRIWVNLSVSLARKPSGEPDFLICVAEDITDRKIAEFIPERLTEREMEVLCHIAAGKTNPQIARQLSHSLGTVKSDVRRIIAKLEARDRKQAASRAIEIGLIFPPLY
jgi:PAS domain S-box-containing protein